LLAGWLDVATAREVGFDGFGGGCFENAVDFIILADEEDRIGTVGGGLRLGDDTGGGDESARMRSVELDTEDTRDAGVEPLDFVLSLCTVGLSPSHAGGTIRLVVLDGGGRGLKLAVCLRPFSPFPAAIDAGMLSTSTQSSSSLSFHGFASLALFNITPSFGGRTELLAA
jgi:hypothetical protein